MEQFTYRELSHLQSLVKAEIKQVTMVLKPINQSKLERLNNIHRKVTDEIVKTDMNTPRRY